jgi:hypothetical protein
VKTNRFSSVTGVQFIEARGITAAKFLPLFFYDVEKGLIWAFPAYLLLMPRWGD